jgi:hypothetical protein
MSPRMFLIQTKRVVDNIIRRFVCCNEMFNVYGRCNFNRCKTELNNDTCIIRHCGKNLYQTTGSRRLNPQVSNLKFLLYVKRSFRVAEITMHFTGRKYHKSVYRKLRKWIIFHFISFDFSVIMSR